MADIKGLQQETMALIDTSKALVDKVLNIVKLVDVNPSLSNSFSTNPIGFLLGILRQLGVKQEDLLKFLTNILVWVAPSMEYAVKGILLSNLKNMVSCSSDPMIPEKYRKANKQIADSADSTEDYGIEIDVRSIDFNNKLSVCPLDDNGKLMYFGLEGVNDVYKLTRAVDFDAFLWFVIHRSQFPKSTIIDNVSDIGGTPTPSNATLFDAFTLSFPSSGSTVQLGNTFAKENGSIVSMCFDKQYVKSKDGKENRVSSATFLPISDDWNSINWYKRKLTTKSNKSENRDYCSEMAICNLQYIDQSATSSPITGVEKRKIRFTILPKPYISKPDVENGDMPWRFKKLRFDSQINPDDNGKYTVLKKVEGIKINSRTGQIYFNNERETEAQIKKDTEKQLIECYPGKTVYEFNYDYIMSLKLFDSKTLTASLIGMLDNASVDLNGTYQLSQVDSMTEYINNIIKNVIESDDSKTNDCYYTFSNAQYDAQLKKTQAKRASSNKSKFSKAYEILSEIDNLESGDTVNLHQTEEIISRAITQATIDATESTTETNTHGTSWNFTFNLVQNIAAACINGILTPKVILLLQVNQKIMGGNWQTFTFADIIKAMEKVIVSIVKEVVDLMVQELLKFTIKQLKPILETMSAAIASERIQGYADLISDIIKNCPVIWFSLNSTNTNTVLDTVDYADIDTTEVIRESTSTNNC